MKKINSAVFIALLVGTVSTLCLETTRGSIAEITWIKYSENPLDLEPERTVESWVIFESGNFKMWYTGIDNLGTSRIYYATSLDGVNWASHGMVLDTGDPGSWEGLAVGRPVVMFDGTTYKMWYMGYSHNPFPAHRIGYATSPDGIVWTKHSSNPILIPGGNGGWDDGGLGEFTVFFNGSTYIMWFNGQAYMHATLKIGVATSPDGISWTKYSNNPVLVPGPSLWDNKHVYSGPVMNLEGSYKMWYSGQSYADNVRIGLATSSDGLTWTKGASNPVLDVGPPAAWDSAYVYATSIVKEADRLLMWYWGSSDPAGGTVRIGLATTLAPAEIEIAPHTLNLKSNGEWITAYIELPEGHDVNDIDVNSILLNETIPVDAEAPTEVGDYDLDVVPDLMIKFDRAMVIDWIGAADYGEDTGKYYEMNLTIMGTVAGTQFSGTDKIKVLGK